MDALAGTRILLVGDDPDAVAAARRALAGAGAVVDVASGDPAGVIAAVAEEAPAAVVDVDGDGKTLRDGLDPLGLAGGPEVVPLQDLGGAADPLAPQRLRALVDRHALRAGRGELEAIVAAQAVGRRRDLEAAALDGLRRLALAAEYRDDNTHEHTQRVGELAARLARRLGHEDRRVWLVRQTAPLHDLGKIAVPDSILLKPGRLTPEEFEVIKTHAVLGARVLAGGESDLLQTAERVVRSHHERWDGGGYPDALAGAAIPVEARLVAVADVFDVLVHERPYKESWTTEAAADEIRRGAGGQFDPDVVSAFDALMRDAEDTRDPAR